MHLFRCRHTRSTRAKMKNHKQRFNCFYPAPTGRVRYAHRTYPVWPRQKGKVFMFFTCQACPVCLPDVSGMARAERKSVYVLHMPDVSDMSTGRVRYFRKQNTDWIATESLIHIFSYILNLRRSLWFIKSTWIVSISWTNF